MLIIPAIDIKDCSVVRLTLGDFNREKVYFSDPFDIAKKFDSLNVKRVHIVDLNAAKDGTSKNKKIIIDIASRIKADIELGGGIRDEETLKSYFKAGIKYAVMGTKAYTDPEWFKRMLSLYQEKIILAVDSASGFIKIKGWLDEVSVKIKDYIVNFIDSGLKQIIYTDVSRDGTLRGFDIDSLSCFLNNIGDSAINIIVSGGFKDKEDIIKIKEISDKRINGIIIGKALYEGRIDLNEFKGGIYV